MSTLITQFVIIVTLILVFLIKLEGYPTSPILSDEITKNSTNKSVLVKAIGVDQESPDCSTRPWICSTGEIPPRTVCCGNRCVDVTKDVNNCGICGVICPLVGNFQCCNGICSDININPFNCGGCGRICPFLCLLGRCPFTPPTPPPLLPPGLPKQNLSMIPNY